MKRLLLFLLLLSGALYGQDSTLTRVYIDGRPYTIVGGGGGSDSQTLAFNSPTLSISNGNSVNLSALQDGTGTDDQTLTLVGTDLTIEGGNTVDLSGIGGGTDDQTASEVPVSPAVNALTNVQAVLEDHETRIDGLAGGGADGVVTAVALAGTSLNFTGTGGGFNGSVSLASLQDGTGTDSQTLTFTSPNLTISGGNSVNLAALDTNTQLSEEQVEDFVGGMVLSGGDGISYNDAAGTLEVVDSEITITTSQISDFSITAQTGTGAALNLSGYFQYNFSAASSSTSYTVTGAVPGGYAEALINAATEPTVTGATKIPNTQAFIASTPMILHVKAFGSTIKYWFTEF